MVSVTRAVTIPAPVFLASKPTVVPGAALVLGNVALGGKTCDLRVAVSRPQTQEQTQEQPHAHHHQYEPPTHNGCPFSLLAHPGLPVRHFVQLARGRVPGHLPLTARHYTPVASSMAPLIGIGREAVTMGAENRVVPRAISPTYGATLGARGHGQPIDVELLAAWSHW